MGQENKDIIDGDYWTRKRRVLAFAAIFYSILGFVAGFIVGFGW